MTRFLSSMLLLSLVLTPAIAQQTAPPVLTSTISKVTVYSDRALVTRAANLKARGTSTAVFGKLPGWIDEESVRLSVSPSDGVRITDVQVQRVYLARTSDKDIQKAQDKVQAISDSIAAVDDELKILDKKVRHLESIKVFSLEKLPRDAALRDVNVENYSAVVEYITKSLRDTATERRKVMHKRRELEPELRASQKKLNELRQLTQLEETRITATLQSSKPRDVTLTLTYMLPGATWEPAHELRVAGKDPRKAALTSYAIVTQTTGEDWTKADISFSTQSSTKTIRIPELDALLVGGNVAAAQVMAGKSSSFSKALKNYHGQNQLWYNVNNPNDSIQDFNGNVRDQFANTERILRIFTALQKRGTTAHFDARVRTTIRSDGKSVRVPTGEILLDTASKIVAAPQVSLNAARTLEMTNAGKIPLLPGSVSLYHDGAFLGMTQLDFVAEGEPFAIFLGVADKIKLARQLDKKSSSITRGKKTLVQANFTISVENLGKSKAKVNLADRIPVSQNKEIEIDRISIEPEAKPNDKGLLNWELTLGPGQKQEIKIGYRIEYPPAILYQKARQQQMGGAAMDDADLSIELNDLEAQF